MFYFVFKADLRSATGGEKVVCEEVEDDSTGDDGVGTGGSQLRNFYLGRNQLSRVFLLWGSSAPSGIPQSRVGLTTTKPNHTFSINTFRQVRTTAGPQPDLSLPFWNNLVSTSRDRP
jgi:hypothetical protein